MRDHAGVALKAVIFDIGGVLEVNPATGWRDRWAARLGWERSELIRRLGPIWSQGDIGASSLPEIERQTAEALGLGEADLRAFMNDLWTEYLGRLNDELAAYFARLRPRYRTGILSNSFVGARGREREAYGLEDMCDLIVYSHEEGVKKPDPRSYAIVCRRLDVQPAEAIFLDDTQACVEGARRVGLAAIRFINTEQAMAELDAALGLTPAA